MEKVITIKLREDGNLEFEDSGFSSTFEIDGILQAIVNHRTGTARLKEAFKPEFKTFNPAESIQQ